MNDAQAIIAAALKGDARARAELHAILTDPWVRMPGEDDAEAYARQLASHITEGGQVKHHDDTITLEAETWIEAPNHHTLIVELDRDSSIYHEPWIWVEHYWKDDADDTAEGDHEHWFKLSLADARWLRDRLNYELGESEQ